MIVTEPSARRLTPGEQALTLGMFGPAIDLDRVQIKRRKFWSFHPCDTTMAPDGHLWFHPDADHYCDDFSVERLQLRGHFLHEMTHVWQAQRHGRWHLPLRRHPWCRYDYILEPGKAFDRYGIEQQAEIVRHAFLLRQGLCIGGKPDCDAYEQVLPFTRLT